MTNSEVDCCQLKLSGVNENKLEDVVVSCLARLSIANQGGSKHVVIHAGIIERIKRRNPPSCIASNQIYNNKRCLFSSSFLVCCPLSLEGRRVS
jgi:hypothetical protein